MPNVASTTDQSVGLPSLVGQLASLSGQLAAVFAGLLRPGSISLPLAAISNFPLTHSSGVTLLPSGERPQASCIDDLGGSRSTMSGFQTPSVFCSAPSWDPDTVSTLLPEPISNHGNSRNSPLRCKEERPTSTCSPKMRPELTVDVVGQINGLLAAKSETTNKLDLLADRSRPTLKQLTEATSFFFCCLHFRRWPQIPPRFGSASETEMDGESGVWTAVA